MRGQYDQRRYGLTQVGIVRKASSERIGPVAVGYRQQATSIVCCSCPDPVAVRAVRALVLIDANWSSLRSVHFCAPEPREYDRTNKSAISRESRSREQVAERFVWPQWMRWRGLFYCDSSYSHVLIVLKRDPRDPEVNPFPSALKESIVFWVECGQTSTCFCQYSCLPLCLVILVACQCCLLGRWVIVSRKPVTIYRKNIPCRVLCSHVILCNKQMHRPFRRASLFEPVGCWVL